MGTKQRVWTVQEIYDPLTGTFLRWPIRTNDIHNVVGSVKSGTLVCSTIAAANTNLYPYLIRVSAVATPATYYVLVNTATVAVIDARYAPLNGYGLGPTDPDVSPICKVAAAATIELRAAATGTHYGMMVMKRIPTNAKINT